MQKQAFQTSQGKYISEQHLISKINISRRFSSKQYYDGIELLLPDMMETGYDYARLLSSKL